VIGPEFVPELAGMLMSLNFLKMSDGSGSRANLEEFKNDYRMERVDQQIKYFNEKADLSDRKAKEYGIAIKISTVIAIIANVAVLLSSFVLKGKIFTFKSHLLLTGSIFFQIAAIAGAMFVVNDHERRRVRYRELHDLLREWDKQLAFAQTWPTLLKIAASVEKALLAEVIEWKSLILHHKLPRR
jgi:hypothetical protein